MSKSLGNSLSIRDALKMYNYEVIKYVLLSKHYATDMDIHDSDYKIAEEHMYYFYSTIKKMNEFIMANAGDANGETLDNETLKNIVPKFIEVMDDDFNSALAISNLHIIFRDINNMMKTANKGNVQIVANTLAKALEDIKSVYKILGFFEQELDEFINKMREKYLNKLNINTNEIEEQINKRAEAKKNKDYETADAIRAELDKKGILLNDTKEGTTWDIKELYS